MSDFSVFMMSNAEKVGVEKFVASKRFVSDGKPVEWEIVPIDSDTDDELRKQYTKKVPIVGKRGQFTLETDTDKYISAVCAACTKYPDLNNAELQDSYGVKDGMALLKRMLLPGEYTEYKAKVMEINGYDLSMDDLVDEAKN